MSPPPGRPEKASSRRKEAAARAAQHLHDAQALFRADPLLFQRRSIGAECVHKAFATFNPSSYPLRLTPGAVLIFTTVRAHCTAQHKVVASLKPRATVNRCLSSAVCGSESSTMQIL